MRILTIVSILVLTTAPAAKAAWPAPGQALHIALPAVPPQSGDIQPRIYTEDGIAPALARDLAKATGRNLVPTFLGDAAAQLWLDMRDDAAEAMPTGYRSGMTVAMRSDTDIADWTDLAGRTVCFTADNDQARALIAEFGGIPVPERAPALSLMKVRTGECDAGLHQAALLQHLFRQPDWKKFSATLPVRGQAALVAGVADLAAMPAAQAALAPIITDAAWQTRTERWAKNVAFEVWLEQDAPDCH